MTIPSVFRGRYAFQVGDQRHIYDLDTTGGFLVIESYDPPVVVVEYPDGRRVRQEPVEIVQHTAMSWSVDGSGGVLVDQSPTAVEPDA